MQEIKRLCLVQKRLKDFWKRLVERKITLLTQDEAVDSDVTHQEAEEFLLESVEEDAMDIDEPSPAEGPQEVDEENAEDLLKMLQ